MSPYYVRSSNLQGQYTDLNTPRERDYGGCALVTALIAFPQPLSPNLFIEGISIHKPIATFPDPGRLKRFEL